ncbi:uncharacterized protein LOC110039401 [Phalaenopsis equestris]|uniref:uncharacterized protein LOC110039401 n=1 Tax=Phalaenopsis equestris TaxID=78828 RepID=UPI0009E293C2|nr:uncharacterized protein LOC110039401 [Phalaenopsis equestris]
MSASFSSSTLAAPASSPKFGKWPGSARSPSNRLVHFRRSFPTILASAGNASSSIGTGTKTEMDAVSSFSEIVPDTVVFDDFEKFPPTAATVSSSLLLGICSLPDTRFKSAVEIALANSECYEQEEPSDRMTCFFNKALVNVGADLAGLVPGRVSTEVDARLAYDTRGIIHKVHELLRLYNEAGVSSERLLFKIPATWQGIEASRLLEAEGIQTHLTFVYSFMILQVIKTYNYIHKYGYKSKLMAAAIRNKQDLFGILGVDYIIAPLKILQSLKESVTFPDEKYSYIRRLSPSSAKEYDFTDKELLKWDQRSFASAMGPCAEELLASGLDGYVNQTRRVEELFGKIWPLPCV